MLQIRPNCEYCDKDLAPDAADAMICSYECTFCSDCADSVLHNVCPNCGGGFEKRPIRPRAAYRPRTGLAHAPASTERKHLKHDPADLSAFIAPIRSIPASER